MYVSGAVFCGAALLKSTVAVALICVAGGRGGVGLDRVGDEAGAGALGVVGRQQPLVGSVITSPVSGSIAWISQVAVPVCRSTPALTRRMNPLVCVKSKSPWNSPMLLGMWMSMSPILMSPSRNVRGSRLGSSWVVMRISPGVGRRLGVVLEVDRERQRLAGRDEAVVLGRERPGHRRQPGVLALVVDVLIEVERDDRLPVDLLHAR